MSQEIVITAAVRTAVGSFNGSLSTLAAVNLGGLVVGEALKRSGIAGDDVSDVIMGHVLTAGLGQNTARQAAVKGGVPYSVPAMTINMVCGSGLRAATLAAQSIQCGDASIVVAGGQESMSLAHHSYCMRAAPKFGNIQVVDTMVNDGLTDVFNNYHMGVTAENVAKKYNVSREDQDKFAAESQRRTAIAQQNNYFQNEIIPVTVKSRKGDIVINRDEHPRNTTTVEVLAKLRPAFVTDGSGSVTAGNASGLNDGAAALIMMSRSEAEKRNCPILAKFVTWAHAAIDPSLMGMGPLYAIQSCVKKAGWSLEEVDLFEINEAFASQSVAVVRELGCDPDKVNIGGGAIALGHPIGASGARILVTLLHALKRTGGRKGVAALCIGGGMGMAVCVENVQ